MGPCFEQAESDFQSEVLSTVKSLDPGSPADAPFLKLVKYQKSNPRIFKTHLPFSMLAADMLDKCKVNNYKLPYLNSVQKVQIILIRVNIYS